jgi:signal transduction histidine kinase
VDESVGVLVASLAVAVPVVLALLAALVWWLSGRVLRPVELMRAEVAGIRGGDLHRRLPVSDAHDEISRLARTLNEMLARVEEATVHQRRFVADASHELRGPLTRLRSELEVAMAHPDLAEAPETLASLHAEVTGLQELVEDLLFLARFETGAYAPAPVPVDLEDLVFAEARRLRADARVKVDIGAVRAVRVAGDPRQLARMIRNLTENAERHAGHTVTFELGEHDGECRLVVGDDGPGIPPGKHRSVFERFVRLDEARSRDAGGAGLGLAIVHDIVVRHGGTIRIDDAEGGGARFVITLPTI